MNKKEDKEIGEEGNAEEEEVEKNEEEEEEKMWRRMEKNCREE